jgi:threonine/homoserine/homoserine lactone efflux protein
MSFEVFAALAVFAFVSSITPGPNNMMLMASGANFGFARTIPHMLGISVGFVVLLVLVGVGLAQVFDLFPALYQILKIVSVVYLLYLAWKIATAASIKTRAVSARPMTFLQAALFQWVNPKAWSMALTVISVYAPDTSFTMLAIIGVVFATVNLPSVTVWTVLGREMTRVLTTSRRLVYFNWTMAVLLVASLYPVLVPASL